MRQRSMSIITCIYILQIYIFISFTRINCDTEVITLNSGFLPANTATIGILFLTQTQGLTAVKIKPNQLISLTWVKEAIERHGIETQRA